MNDAYVFDGQMWVKLDGDTTSMFARQVEELPKAGDACKGDVVRLLGSKSYVYGVINTKPSDSCPVSGWMFDTNCLRLSLRARSLRLEALADALERLAHEEHPATFHGKVGNYLILIDVH